MSLLWDWAHLQSGATRAVKGAEYNTIQYKSLQDRTGQDKQRQDKKRLGNTIQYNAHTITIQYTIRYNTTQHNTVL